MTENATELYLFCNETNPHQDEFMKVFNLQEAKKHLSRLMKAAATREEKPYWGSMENILTSRYFNL